MVTQAAMDTDVVGLARVEGDPLATLGKMTVEAAREMCHVT